MRNFIFLSLTVFLALAITKTAFSDNRYWVNGSGNWNDPQQWSETSGGAPGASIPTKEDHVIFDHNSFTSNNQTVIIKDVVYCNDFRWEVDNYQPNLKSSAFLFKKWTKAEIHVHGSFIIGENINHEFFGDIVLKSSKESTIEVDSKLTADVIIDATNGEYGLRNDFETEGDIYLKSGTLNSNDKNIETNAFIGSGTKTRTLVLGKSEIKINNWDFQQDTNIRFDAGNSNIIFKKGYEKEAFKPGNLEYNSFSKSGIKAAFGYTINVTDVTCNGAEDGVIEAIVTSGGVQPFTYVLYEKVLGVYSVLESSGPVNSTSYTFNPSKYDPGLPGNTYLVDITDSEGTTDGGPVVVQEPDELLPGAISITKGLSCFDSEDGELQANPTGGTIPYIYQWYKWDGSTFNVIPGENSQKLSNIGQGIYQVEVDDQNGCGIVTAQKNFTKAFAPGDIPDEIIITGIDYTNSCTTPNNTGTITISGDGGTAPLSYAIVRSSDSDSTTNSTGVFENLTADTYKTYVIDDNGCFKQGTNVTITQLQNPTASIIPVDPTICPSATIELDGNPTLSPDASSIDNHEWTGDVSNLDFTDIQKPDFTGSSIGTFNLTYTVTDNNGCTGTDNVTITVEDNDPPTAVCQDITVELDATGNVTISGADIDNGSTDNCTSPANLTLTATPNTFDCTDIGINNVTLTVTDEVGNSSACTAAVTVEDNEAPTISCIGDQTVNSDTGVCTYTHGDLTWDATGSDNCSVASITYNLTGATSGSGTSLNGVTFNIGITTVTWTIDDGNGQTAQCSYDVTVEDNEAPTISCIGNQTVSSDAGVCTYTHGDLTWDATGSDNCGSSTITYNLTGATSGSGTSLNGVTFSLGITTVTWSIDDGNGQTAQCSYDVTVEDNEAPTISCIGNQTLSSDPGVCTYTHGNLTWDATGSDNCVSSTITYNLTGATSGSGTSLNGVTFNVGITTVTWTITDGSGLTAQCSYDVTVEDNEAPTISCIGNQTVSSDPGVCTYTHGDLTWDATGSDNCSVVSITYNLTGATSGSGTSLNGVTFNTGTTTVTWTIDDGNGQTAQCSYDITVEDNEAPTISCIGDQTVNSDAGVCTYTHGDLTWDATGSDNCSVASITYNLTGATSGSGTSLNGVTFNVGITTVTWTITDGSGLTAQCSYDVTVEDNEAPTISCIGNQTVNSDAGVCTYTHGDLTWDATGSDNCGSSTITYNLTGATSGSGTSLNGVTFNVGITTVTWTIDDGNGQTAQCSYDVTVEDNEAPTISCIGNQTVSSDAGVCTYTHGDLTWDASGSDNCVSSTITYNLTGATSGSGTSLNGVTFNIGITTVTWTIDDGNGQTAQCSYDVTVEDNEAPVIICPADTSLIQDGSCTAVVNNLSPVVSDNCSVVLQTWTMTGATTNSSAVTGINDVSGETFEIGVTTVEYYIEDASGNSATCSFIAEIYDEVDGGLIAADQNICYNTTPNPFTNVASASVCGGFTYQWQMKTGTGPWVDIPGATNETYTETNPLTEITYYNRKAISDLGFGTANSDTVTITITPAPTVYAGQDTTLCYGNEYHILDADTTNSSAIEWTTEGGDGTFDDETILDPMYTPGPNDLLKGYADLVLRSYNNTPCSDVTDTIRVNYLPELLASIGKPSPFLIDSASTQIRVYFKISNHQYLSFIGLYLVSPLDSVVELKPICSSLGQMTATENMAVEFYNDPDNSSGLSPISSCNPMDGQWLFLDDWKKKLQGQDPANGSWRLMIKDSLNFGTPGVLEEAAITFSDTNYTGTFESVVYADSSINLNITGHIGTGPAAETEYALPITGLTTSCYGVCDATAVGTASGGQPPYVSYEWSDVPDFSNIIATTDTVDLCAGTFYLRITDSHGCTAIDSVTVGEPPAIIIDSDTVVHNICYGDSIGKIAIAFSGGTGSLQYTINGTDWYNSGDTIENLGAGDYLATIMDATGCTKDTLITINQPTPIKITTTYSDISCYGSTDGQIEITASGGTPGVINPYEYSIDSAQTWQLSNIFGGLSNDTFYVAVQDSLGCVQFGDTIIISEPDTIVIDSIITIPYSCFGEGDDGEIIVYASGGVGELQFSLTGDPLDFQADSNFTGLIGGTYSIYIKDSCGVDTFENAAVITGPDPIVIDSINVTDVSTCYGANTGKIDVYGSGGSGVFGYSIDGGVNYQANNNFTGLSAGSYTIYIKDDKGCLSPDSTVTINEPDQLLISDFDVLHTSECNYPQNAGIITITASGGTLPYQYSIDSGVTWQVNSTFDSLYVDNYSIIVQDANLCSSQTIDTSIILRPAMEIEINSTPVTCYGYENGSISVTPHDGTPVYTYQWNTGDSTSTINNLSQGWYTVTVIDSNIPQSCEVIDSVEIVEPDPLEITATLKDIFCINSKSLDRENSNGKINISASGGTPYYTYNWTGPSGFTSGSYYITDLEEGTYYLTVTDANGCDTTYNTSISKDNAYDINFAIELEDSSICWNEELIFNSTSNGADTIFIQKYQQTGGVWVATDWYIEITDDEMSFTDEELGGNARYDLEARNDYCYEDTSDISVAYFPDRELIIIENDEVENDTIIIKGENGRWEAMASVNNSSGLIVSWTPTVGVANPDSLFTRISPSESMWYSVQIITQEGGCADSDSIYIEYVPDIVTYDGFSPNGDGINDFWYIENIDKFKNNVVTVYTRWGTKVYEQKGYSNDDSNKRWDGTAKNGKALGSGTYYYVIILNEEGFSPLTGAITIMR